MEDCSIDVNNKIYIKPADLAIKDNEIYVLLNQNWVKTNTIHSDAKGIFVDSAKTQVAYN